MHKKPQILLVDDDNNLRETLAEQLELDNMFQTSQADNIESGKKLALESHFDAMILDVGLPDGDGRKLCRDLRDANIACPILMLTANDSESDTINGLEAGANDYISKPFRLGELIARLNAHLRLFSNSDEALLRIADYDFRPSRKTLSKSNGEREIRLTEKEVGILKYLYHANPPLVSREKLLDEVWGYNANVTTHTLETHIYRLRQKIEENPKQAKIVLTGEGGYRLAEV